MAPVSRVQSPCQCALRGLVDRPGAGCYEPPAGLPPRDSDIARIAYRRSLGKVAFIEYAYGCGTRAEKIDPSRLEILLNSTDLWEAHLDFETKRF